MYYWCNCVRCYKCCRDELYTELKSCLVFVVQKNWHMIPYILVFAALSTGIMVVAEILALFPSELYAQLSIIDGTSLHGCYVIYVGRATITDTWQNSLQATTARKLRKTACWHTRLQAIQQTTSCRQLIQLDLVLRSTSLFSTMRSWTRQTAPVDWQRLHLTTQLPSWTHWVRNHTKTRHWSCSCWETTWHCGRQTCRLMTASSTQSVLTNAGSGWKLLTVSFTEIDSNLVVSFQ